MIAAIDISPFKDYIVAGRTSNKLDNLTGINLFVGSNNSGKSRFLRKLLLNKLSVQSSKIDIEAISKLVSDLSSHMGTLLGKFGSHNTEIQRVKDEIKNIQVPDYINDIQVLKKINGQIRSLGDIQTNIVDDGYGFNPQFTYQQIRAQVQPYIKKLDQLEQSYNDLHLQYEKVYLPILRGLRPLQIDGEPPQFNQTSDNYRLRLERDYEIEEKHGIAIHTGLDMYRNVTELLLGDHDDRLKIQEFENYLSSTFFQGQPVHIVPRSGKDVLYIKIGEDRQYPIYELGEGVQSVILLTYPLFFNESKNMVFFIEEPELHLHPGLERIFIETLRNPRFESFQYFITTHSNHILDLTLEYEDIAVYSFEKKQTNGGFQFVISNVNSNHKQLLELLGVRNSSVFLSNCTIWVEGITDRLYLRKFLEVMQAGRQSTFREDYHYSFVEYAGNNITHWSFLESEDEQFLNINIDGICSKIFLIADNDGVDIPSKRSKQKKQQRQEQLQQKLGDHFYVTKGLEMENLLSRDVITKVILDTEGGNKGLDFTAFDRLDYTKKYVGDFIQSNVKGLQRKYANEYGTVHDKINFCKKAVSQIKTVDDLSEEAKELTEKLLVFIAESNR